MINQSECDIAIMVDGKKPNVIDNVKAKYNDDTYHLEENLRSPMTRTPKKRTTPIKSSRSRDVTPNKRGTPSKSSSARDYTKKVLFAERSPRKVVSNCTKAKLSSEDRLAMLNRALLDETDMTSSGVERTVLKDLNQCFIEGQDTVNESLTSTLDMPANKLNIPYDITDQLSNLNVTDEKQLGCALKDSNDANKVCIKVNMSTSVTKELLSWIYSGMLLHSYYLLLLRIICTYINLVI